MIQSIRKIFTGKTTSNRMVQRREPLSFSSSFDNGKTINPKAVESLAASVFKKFAFSLAVITTAVTVVFEALKKYINGFLVSTAKSLDAIEQPA